MHILFLSSTILLLLSAFLLGVYSLVRNYRSLVIKLWFLLSMAITVWMVGYLWAILTKDYQNAFKALRIVYFGVSLIPILFFHFITSFLYKVKKNQILIFLGYILALIFLILTSSTKLIIKGVQYLANFGYHEDITLPGFYFFLIYFLFFVVYGFILLVNEYNKSDGIRRRQIFYLIIAYIFGFVGGMTNFIMDIFNVYPYGQLFVWLYPIFITYGIFMNKIKIIHQ